MFLIIFVFLHIFALLCSALLSTVQLSSALGSIPPLPMICFTSLRIYIFYLSTQNHGNNSYIHHSISSNAITYYTWKYSTEIVSSSYLDFSKVIFLKLLSNIFNITFVKKLRVLCLMNDVIEFMYMTTIIIFFDVS